jgi:hypothetical protein
MTAQTKKAEDRIIQLLTENKQAFIHLKKFRPPTRVSFDAADLVGMDPDATSRCRINIQAFNSLKKAGRFKAVDPGPSRLSDWQLEFMENPTVISEFYALKESNLPEPKAKNPISTERVAIAVLLHNWRMFIQRAIDWENDFLDFDYGKFGDFQLNALFGEFLVEAGILDLAPTDRQTHIFDLDYREYDRHHWLQEIRIINEESNFLKLELINKSDDGNTWVEWLTYSGSYAIIYTDESEIMEEVE